MKKKKKELVDRKIKKDVLFVKLRVLLKKNGYERINFRRMEELYYSFFRSKEIYLYYIRRVDYKVYRLRKKDFILFDPLLKGSPNVNFLNVYLKKSIEGKPRNIVILLQSGQKQFICFRKKHLFFSDGNELVKTYFSILSFLVHEINKIRLSLVFSSLRFFLSKLLFYFLSKGVKKKIIKLVSVLRSKDNYSFLRYFIYLFLRLGFLDFSESDFFFTKKVVLFPCTMSRLLQRPFLQFRSDPLFYSEKSFEKASKVYLRHFRFPMLEKIMNFGFLVPSSFFFFEKQYPISLNKRIGCNVNPVAYLLSILMEMGVHIGTEINGHGRYKRGYNEWFSGYVLGFFRLRQLDNVFYRTFRNHSVRTYKKGFFYPKELFFPVINLQATLLVLQSALRGIKGLGKLGGRLLFFHSDLWSFPGFFLFLGSISDFFGHSCNYMPWIPGAVSNYLFILRYFFDKFFSNARLSRRRIKGTSFISFFFRVLFLNCFLTPTDILEDEFENECFFLWRMLIFFRYFTDYFYVPDMIIGIDPIGKSSALTEYSTQRLASMSSIDTDSNLRGPLYGIPSNDDSFVIAAFFFSVAMNAYEHGRMNRFKSNFLNFSFSKEKVK